VGHHSSERGKRPHEFQDQRTKKKAGFCPFCAGNERTTPSEILNAIEEHYGPHKKEAGAPKPAETKGQGEIKVFQLEGNGSPEE
jgi:galactose-1-phosphate uridylyltransferase